VPSARLEQIREMSRQRGIVRTTYYGRLRPEQPAYTIATYYNRPGNGTNIHPHQDRTLTTREAARLQSFPDHYVFLGTEGAQRKQVGNAVPPLLGYAVGEKLAEPGGAGICVDFFSGAGGLSKGLELAGWRVAAAVEKDRHAVSTYAFNHPSTTTPDPTDPRALLRKVDLTSAEARASVLADIRTHLGNKKVDLVAGGPPCQGFSTAGWRSKTDTRNDLAIIFLDMVAALSPRLVCLENVEGLLNYRKGQVLIELQRTLAEMGYTTTPIPWRLTAEQYGVPQMRKRIFLVGQKGGPALSAPIPRFARCLGRREKRGPALLPDTLPYPTTVAEALSGLPPLAAVRYPQTGPRPVRPGFARWTSGALSVAEFLSGSAT